MKKAIIIIFIFFTGTAFSITFKEVKEIAFKDKLFILAYFRDTTYENRFIDLNLFASITIHDNNLFDKYYILNIYTDHNEPYKEIYKVDKFPTILMLDWNGLEVGRYNIQMRQTSLRNFLVNYQFSDKLLEVPLNNYHNHKNFQSAIKVAESYFDYSLIIDKEYKFNVFNACNSYFEIALDFIKRKDKNLDVKKQKIKLMMLFKWAYNKNFDILNEKLLVYKNEEIFEENQLYYYFLKYIASKALMTDEFKEIDEKTRKIEGFDIFVKKAELIMNQN